jgi:hypothetical protein
MDHEQPIGAMNAAIFAFLSFLVLLAHWCAVGSAFSTWCASCFSGLQIWDKADEKVPLEGESSLRIKTLIFTVLCCFTAVYMMAGCLPGQKCVLYSSWMHALTGTAFIFTLSFMIMTVIEGLVKPQEEELRAQRARKGVAIA